MPFRIAQQKAIQQYEAAFHLLNVTFPLVKDPKLLVGIIHNIFSSYEYAIDALLAHERQLKLVPKYGDDFQSKFNTFRLRCVRRNQISPDHINLIIDLKELLEIHKKCPIEFQRGNRYVLATKDYRLKTISLGDLRDYIYLNKAFLDQVKQILTRF